MKTTDSLFKQGIFGVQQCTVTRDGVVRFRCTRVTDRDGDWWSDILDSSILYGTRVGAELLQTRWTERGRPAVGGGTTQLQVTMRVQRTIVDSRVHVMTAIAHQTGAESVKSLGRSVDRTARKLVAERKSYLATTILDLRRKIIGGSADIDDLRLQKKLFEAEMSSYMETFEI